MLAIVKSDLDRVVADAALATTSGFSLRAPLYTLGTPVDAVGIATYRASRATFDELPRLRDVVDAAITRIRDEERTDVRATLGQLAMQDDGRVGLSMFGEMGASLTLHAFGQLVRRAGLPGGAVPYLSACPSHLRAQNMDEWLPRVADIPALVRTRRVVGDRSVYAVLGTRYRTCDADTLAQAILETAPSGARGELQYDGARFEVRAVWHSDIAPTNAVVGELFKAFVAVESADDGSRAIRIKVGVVRNLCRNFMILDVAEQANVATHRRADLAASVRRMLGEAGRKISAFASQWSEARRDRIIEEIHGVYDPAPIFAQLVRQGLVEVPGVEDSDLVARLVRAWEAEPGCTRADVVNAITRSAHEEPWSSPWTSGHLEEQAGQLLHQRVVLR